MKLEDFHQLYVAELQELRSVEDQLVHALPDMAKHATHPQLKQGIATHLEETRTQRNRLDEMLERHGAHPREHRDDAMRTIVHEAAKWVSMIRDANLRDAALIAAAQRIEHYEIAVYGTMATWSKRLGHEEDLQALLLSLAEEKRTDEALTELAKSVVNADAATK